MKKYFTKFITYLSKKRKETVNFAKQKTAEEISTEICLLIENQFRNWVTAQEVFDKFKKQFGDLKYTENLLQTLVYKKLAIVKQLDGQRPRYKLTSKKQLRPYIIKQLIEEYSIIVESLKQELKNY